MARRSWLFWRIPCPPRMTSSRPAPNVSSWKVFHLCHAFTWSFSCCQNKNNNLLHHSSSKKNVLPYQFDLMLNVVEVSSLPSLAKRKSRARSNSCKFQRLLCFGHTLPSSPLFFRSSNWVFRSQARPRPRLQARHSLVSAKDAASLGVDQGATHSQVDGLHWAV